MRDNHLVQLESGFCFMCGKPFNEGDLKKTKHHCIPRTLKPKRNVTLPVHMECHKKLNGLYALQQKKVKAPASLKKFTNEVEGLIYSVHRLNKKMEKLKDNLINEISKVEVNNGRNNNITQPANSGDS